MAHRKEKKRYIGVLFECCNIYKRVYINKEKTAYTGRCPKCYRIVRVGIGKNGTDGRFFKAW